jgi:hypothetical protein
MKTTAKIATTTGPKVVIVGVNLSQTLSDALTGVMEGNFTNVAQLASISDVTSSTTGFVMFSTEPLEITLVKDPGVNQNVAKTKVQRLVAKATVQKANGMTVTGGGYISNLEFTLNNTNKKTFYVQPADRKDHNWASTPTGDLDDNNGDYVAVNETGVTVKSLNPKYCLENTTRDYLMGQITRITVRATFVPDEVKNFKNGTDSSEGYVDVSVPNTTAPATFFLVVCDAGATRAYFFDPAVDAAYASDNNGSTVEYTNGHCYWDIFLNPDNIVSVPYDVLRNDFYRCNITKIVGPGRHFPEVTDPTIPPSQTTDLTVDIEILYWNPISKDYELEP